MCYIYILKCSDNTLYTGWTTNLERRLRCHNSGKGSKYTRCRLPVEIVYSEILEDKSSALKREYEIKRLSREKKLLLIKNNYIET
ncbi:GIY-YIG nuclease family protein [Clostridium sp.]|uniref:GIY-YIG nuclease family protein n=1 Tax=Clostridium sp. TaxID=1506 RepID=UPI003216C673